MKPSIVFSSRLDSAVDGVDAAERTLGVPRQTGARRLGATIELDRITIVEVRRSIRGIRPSVTHVRPLEPPNADGGWDGLREAFAELAEYFGRGPHHLSVALRGPLCHVKSLALPRLNSSEMLRLVERSAARFMAVPSGPFVVGLHQLRARAGKPRRVLALVAPCSLIDTIFHAAEAGGFRVGTITAGPVALAAGALAIQPQLRSGTTALVALNGEALELLITERGRLQLARSVPADLAVSSVVEPNGTYAERIGQLLLECVEHFGLRPDRLTMLSPLEDGSGLGPEAADVPIQAAERLDGIAPAAVAAFGATVLAADAARLVPERQRQRTQRREAVRAAVLLSISAMILFLTAVLHLGGLRRGAMEVDEQRTALRPLAEEVLRARGTLRAVEDRLLTLDSLASARRQWPAVLASLATALPDDSYLVGLQVESGLMRLDIRARSAATVLAAIERSPAFSDVRLAAPVRREGTAHADLERLVLVARSVHPGHTVPTVSRGAATMQGELTTASNQDLATADTSHRMRLDERTPAVTSPPPSLQPPSRSEELSEDTP